ncbi:hypothetical protein KTO58_08195 [Chitinophaga pendula]|uniref:polysaccharide lyase n=1 Tax=Chitinophaga TaxID=79328 RepID=UPI0012FD2497|nr:MULTISPECIES: hypothetical protein [Chitinophaga]UCJ09152.1 hypothetical protein KTO58_08195 [Chitinophaga pendula]
MKSTSRFLVHASWMLVTLGTLGTSCQKENAADPIANTETGTDRSPNTEAIPSSLSINWNNYATGAYSSGNAASDFGNAGGWNQSRSYISDGTLRVTLLKNALSGAGGLISNIDVSDGTEYELDYDVRFHSQFDWSRGGKVGFGFSIGEGNTGGDPGWDGNGGTLRMMWYQTDAGRVFFQPYIYHKDQPGQYGDTFGKSYPSSGSITKGTTYHVHVYIKSNTGSNRDGRAQIIINGTTVLDTAIRWTTNDAQRLIKNMTFHTFRGGSQTYWQSPVDSYIYYDNLVLRKIR